MIFYYKYCDEHNGHIRTYHPFLSETIIDQEKVNEILASSGEPLERIGTSENDFERILNKSGLEIKMLKENEDCGGVEKIIYGICGNY